MKGLFLDVKYRCPGSCHDTRLLASFAVFNKLSNALLPPTVDSNLLGEKQVGQQWPSIISDPAYYSSFVFLNQ